MKWHPYRNKSAEAEERFKRIATAYAILSDPKKRARYDARRFESVAHYNYDDLFGDLDLGSLFGDLGFGPGGDSVFDRFFHRARPRPIRGENIRINVDIPLETIQQGDSYSVSFSHPQVCARCRGQGTADGKTAPVCRACGGSGHKIRRSKKQKAGSGAHVQQIVTCTDGDLPPSAREQTEVAIDANSGSSQCRQLCRIGFLARTAYSACKGSSALVRGMNTKAS